MTFDLGAAMRKKAEAESARLLDFEFRRRARATRLLATTLGLDEAMLVARIVTGDESALLGHLADHGGYDPAVLAANYARCLAEAHARLVAERGDPTPHRLA